MENKKKYENKYERLVEEARISKLEDNNFLNFDMISNRITSLLSSIKPSNIIDSLNIGTMFKENIDTKFIDKTNKNLVGIINKNLILPEINKITKLDYDNNEYLYMVKNFILFYNERHKERIAFFRKSYKYKYKVNDKYYLFLTFFFCEIENYESTKTPTILFMNFKKITATKYDPETIIYSRVIGMSMKSDVFMGSEREIVKKRFIDIFKEEIKYVLPDEINDYILNNKKYVTNYYYDRDFPKREFKTIIPEINKTNKLKKLKLGDKCLDINGSNISFKECKNVKTKVKNTNDKIKTIDNFCLSYHAKNNYSLVPCDSITNCDNNGILNNCNQLKVRKYGGIEIVGMNKCINNNGELSECYKADRVKFI
jgi:hypothetical protein